MRVGVLGAGQLGRMLALAGMPLGLRFRLLDQSAEACGGQVAELLVGRCDDPATLERFAGGLDAVTYEFENVPLQTAERLSKLAPLYPPIEALRVGQDRRLEKQFFAACDIPTPRSEAVADLPGLRSALARIGFPAVLKTCRMGYDGKGQAVLRRDDEVDAAWQRLSGQPLLLEQFVPFQRELSILAARSRDGSIAYYPLVENVHGGGILRYSSAPIADLDPALEERAQAHARRALDVLNYVGVLAIEFFEHAGELLANEMAPRVHNTGHWTIEGAETSQFENHVRAVVGWPLGSTRAIGWSAMINLIGCQPPAGQVLQEPGVHLHWYGKQVQPGRKVGHLTAVCDSAEARDRLGRRLLAWVGGMAGQG